MTADYVVLGGSKGCDLTPDFMNDATARKVEVVLHEDWHTNHSNWAGGAVSRPIAEATASFVGHFGAVEFTKNHFGERSWVYREALKNRDNRINYAYTINNLYDKLKDVYTSRRSFEDKLKRKAEILEEVGLPSFNNATIMQEYLYTKYFEHVMRVYSSTELNVLETIELLKKVPANKSDAEEFLDKY